MLAAWREDSMEATGAVEKPCRTYWHPLLYIFDDKIMTRIILRYFPWLSYEGRRSLPASKYSIVIRYSLLMKPRALLFTALKTLFRSSINAVLNSSCQWARILSRCFSRTFTARASGAIYLSQRSHLARPN